MLQQLFEQNRDCFDGAHEKHKQRKSDDCEEHQCAKADEEFHDEPLGGEIDDGEQSHACTDTADSNDSHDGVEAFAVGDATGDALLIGP